MPVINSSDYHDYVIKDGRFIGEFEQMYRNVADPWRCVGEVGGFKNRLLLAALAALELPTPARALDVGCGLGALTSQLRQVRPAVEWHACDVSVTAIERAGRDYPGIRFFAQDLSRVSTLPFQPGDLQLITMAEVMWYILPYLPDVLARYFEVLSPGGHLLILQYFLALADQRYGREIVSGPADLLRLVRAAGFIVRHEVYLGSEPPQDMLLWAVKPETP